MENAQVLPVPGPDGHPRGASVALVYADGADGLLDAIEALELAEGLPHPTYKGEYVKRSKKAAALYLIIDDPKLTNEERIRYAGRAGASCVYFAGVLEKWILLALRAKLRNKEEKTQEDRDMINALSYPTDYCDTKYILPIVKKVRENEV